MNRIFTLSIFILFFFSNISAQKVIVQQINEALRNGSWVATSKGTYNFDKNCFMIHSLNQDWDTAQNTWKTTFQSDIINNAAGKMTQTVYQKWDTISNSWINNYKQLMSYTPTNKFLEGENFAYANGSWVNDSKIHYQYNSNDLLDNFWGEYYDSTTITWFHTSRSRKIYDANGHNVESWRENWDETAVDWVPYQHTLYHINSQGKTDTSTNYVKRSIDWELQSRSLNDYSVVGITTNTEQSWNTTTLLWENLTQHEDYRDVDGIQLQVINKYWNAASGQFEIYNRVTMTSMDCGAVVPSRMGLISSIFPNPVGSTLKLSLSGSGTAKYFITDINGRKLASGAFDGNETTIPVNNIGSGIYFIHFERDNAKTTHRFMKQ